MISCILEHLTDCYAEMALIASDELSSKNTIKELENLLRFDLEIEAHVYRDSKGPDWSLSEYTMTKGIVELAFDFNFFAENGNFPSPNFTHNLIGTGNFSTEGKAVRKGQGKTDISSVVPDIFEKEYTVQLNFCDLKGEIKCISPGNRKEEWEGDEFINSSLRMIRYTNTFFNELNRYHKNKGRYEFPIKNRQAVLVDDVNQVFQEYENGEQIIRTEFHYKLIHKPEY